MTTGTYLHPRGILDLSTREYRSMWSFGSLQYKVQGKKVLWIAFLCLQGFEVMIPGFIWLLVYHYIMRYEVFGCESETLARWSEPDTGFGFKWTSKTYSAFGQVPRLETSLHGRVIIDNAKRNFSMSHIVLFQLCGFNIRKIGKKMNYCNQNFTWIRYSIQNYPRSSSACIQIH